MKRTDAIKAVKANQERANLEDDHDDDCWEAQLDVDNMSNEDLRAELILRDILDEGEIGSVVNDDEDDEDGDSGKD